jgi:hypothetical protein
VGVVNMERHLAGCEKYQKFQFNNKLKLAFEQRNFDAALGVLGAK